MTLPCGKGFRPMTLSNINIICFGKKSNCDHKKLKLLENSIKYKAHDNKSGTRITFRDGMFEAAQYIGEAYALYVYMTKRIVRPSKRRSWVESAECFYHQGYLPFVMHQNNIANDMGVERRTIIRWLRTLQDCNMIVKLDSVIGKRGSTDIFVNMYSLGHWYPTKRGKREIDEYVFYAEEFRPELMTDPQAVKRYKRSKETAKC